MKIKEYIYDDFTPEDYEVLENRIKNEADRKIFQQVFDSKTLDAIQALASKGLFEAVEHVISTGKEAHVFLASDVVQTKRAVKIFMMETTLFRKMANYITGDRRFKDLRKDRRSVVVAWAKKEYKNLMIANKAKLSTPCPMGYKENVLVMEYIGDGETPAPRLKDSKPTLDELKDYKNQTIDFLSGLYLAGLVHADLSEYNILVHNKKLVVIDFGQATLLAHPNAKEFFQRDVKNMTIYFTKAGLETPYTEFYAQIKKRKEEMEKLSPPKPHEPKSGKKR